MKPRDPIPMDDDPWRELAENERGELEAWLDQTGGTHENE